MNNILKRMQMMLGLFTKIATGITFVSAVYICIFWGRETLLTVDILWQILSVAAICTIGSILLPYDDRKVSKRNMLFRYAVYYLYINIVVLGFGIWFEWFYFSDWKMLLGMEVMIAFVTALVILLSYLADFKEAERMNKKLRERGESGNS